MTKICVLTPNGCCSFQFNQSPMNGINFLEAHNLIPHDPKSIASFLKDTPGLDRVRAPVCLLSLVTEHAQAIPWCSLFQCSSYVGPDCCCR